MKNKSFVAVLLLSLGLSFAAYASFEEENNVKPSTRLSLHSPDEMWILSIDGGGIRGLIPAMLLDHLEKKLNEDKDLNLGVHIADFFDVAAGTSTGSIIALGLSVPDENDKYQPKYAAQKLVDLYQSQGKYIFNPISSWKLKMTHPKYNPEPLSNILETYFKNNRLKDAAKDIHVLVPAYNITLNQEFFFDGLRAREDNAYNFKIREATQASASAPTFFPAMTVQIDEKPHEFIDGGVFMNDPALAAYSRFRKKFAGKKVKIISFGTGEAAVTLPTRLGEKGWLSWAESFPDVAMNGTSGATTRMLTWLKEAGLVEYYRIQASLTEEIILDDIGVENIKKLKNAAALVKKEIEQDEENSDFNAVYKILRHACEGAAKTLKSKLALDPSQNELNLSGLPTRNSYIVSLKEKLESHKNLKSLILQRCAITDKSLQVLCASLRKNTTLTLLNLSQNGIGDMGVAELGKLLESNSTLEALNLTDTGISVTTTYVLPSLIVNKTTKESTSLKILNLSDNPIKNEGLFAFYESISPFLSKLSKPSNLQILMLDRVQIGPAYILKALPEYEDNIKRLEEVVEKLKEAFSNVKFSLEQNGWE